MKRILSLHSRKELRFASIPLVQLFLLVLLMFMKISSASLLQSARIAPSQAAGLLSKDKVLSLLATSLLNRNPYGFPINGSPVF